MIKKYEGTRLRDFNAVLNASVATLFTPNLPIFTIQHDISTNNKELQIVDYVAWSIHRKYNAGDSSYYNIIRAKIRNLQAFLLEKELDLSITSREHLWVKVNFELKRKKSIS